MEFLIVNTGSARGCEKYLEQIQILTDNYEAASSREEKEELCVTFSEKYLMDLPLWSLLLKMRSTKEMYEKAVFHFSFFFVRNEFHCKFVNRGLRHLFSSEYETMFDLNYDYFIFPNSELASDNFLPTLKRLMTKPLDSSQIKKYEKAKKLYHRIKAADRDDQEWFECIQEWDDAEFITHNIEYRMARNICNKDLWKLYIEYLRPRNPKIMLGVYSRYCSFFLDDFEMRAEYEKEAEKLGIVVGDKILDHKEFQSFFPPTIPSKSKYSLIPKTNFNIYFRQSFSFHNSLINYLMDNSKPEILQKLFKSCKYIFKKHPTPICHRLVISTGSPHYSTKLLFNNQALTIKNNESDVKDIKNLYLSNSLHVCQSGDNIIFSKILSQIYRSEIKFLTFWHTTLNFQEYLFLTDSKTVLELNLCNTKIINSKDQSLVFLEDLLITLPNAYHISFENYDDYINFKTFKKLAANPRISKLHSFSISYCNELTFNIHGFLEFLKENITNSSHFKITMIDVTDVEIFTANFLNIINAFLENYPNFKKQCSREILQGLHNLLMLHIK